MNADETNHHEWLGVLGAGVIAAIAAALGMTELEPTPCHAVTAAAHRATTDRAACTAALPATHR